MIQVGNLDWGHLNDILSYLANPIPKSFRLLIAFSWIMLDYPMSFFLLSTWSIFWAGLVKGIILRLSYPLHFIAGSLLHGLKLGMGWWVAHMINKLAPAQRIRFLDFSDLVWT